MKPCHVLTALLQKSKHKTWTQKFGRLSVTDGRDNDPTIWTVMPTSWECLVTDSELTKARKYTRPSVILTPSSTSVIRFLSFVVNVWYHHVVEFPMEMSKIIVRHYLLLIGYQNHNIYKYIPFIHTVLWGSNAAGLKYESLSPGTKLRLILYNSEVFITNIQEISNRLWLRVAVA